MLPSLTQRLRSVNGVIFNSLISLIFHIPFNESCLLYNLHPCILVPLSFIISTDVILVQATIIPHLKHKNNLTSLFPDSTLVLLHYTVYSVRTHTHTQHYYCFKIYIYLTSPLKSPQRLSITFRITIEITYREISKRSCDILAIMSHNSSFLFHAGHTFHLTETPGLLQTPGRALTCFLHLECASKGMWVTFSLNFLSASF